MSEKLRKAARRVQKAFLKFGPVDDGRPEGEEFEAALDALADAEAEERYAEAGSVNAAKKEKRKRT
jgi:hypothetical protein